MELLNKENHVRKQIFEYFGYVEDWRVLPFDDARDYYWFLDAESNEVKFAKDEDNVFEGTIDDGYSNNIYTQIHLPKWVYRGAEFTMIVVDTHTDGNQFLQIFDNNKELTKAY